MSAKIAILLPFTTLNTIIGEPFTELNEVDSTNNYAMAKARQQQAGHGAAWFAHNQTFGKGQRGKKWNSQPEQNIILSVLLNMEWMQVSEQFKLNAAAALGAYDLINNYVPDRVKIKWPNDIYIGDRKAAGILIENILQGVKWQWSVAGFGINVNETKFDSSIKNAVSLKQITGINFNVIELAKELCNCMQKRYELLKQKKFTEIIDNYNSVLYKRNEEVKLKKNNIAFNCMIEKVTEFGQLKIKGTAKENFDFGEIEWLINDKNI